MNKASQLSTTDWIEHILGHLVRHAHLRSHIKLEIFKGKWTPWAPFLYNIYCHFLALIWPLHNDKWLAMIYRESYIMINDIK